jgi:protein-disulfide isomerase
MTKTQTRRKQQTRETNWVVIGILIAAGILVFGGLLFLALRTPSQAEAAQSLAEYCDENPARCMSVGSSDAPVTMVEVSDFGCPHCQTFHLETASALKEQYVDTGSVRWIALPYALGTSTLPATVAAMCAGEQEQYFEFTDALFQVEPAELRISPDGYRQVAESISLDLDEFNACLDSGRFVETVNQNRDAARNVQVSGTPTFFLNDIRLVGAQPLSAFSQTIESLLSNQ